MTDLHRGALEAFNRASHSDALPEMQLVRYADPVRPTPNSIIRSMEMRDFLVSTAIAGLALIVVPAALLVLMVLVR